MGSLISADLEKLSRLPRWCVSGPQTPSLQVLKLEFEKPVYPPAMSTMQQSTLHWSPGGKSKHISISVSVVNIVGCTKEVYVSSPQSIFYIKQSSGSGSVVVSSSGAPHISLHWVGIPVVLRGTVVLPVPQISKDHGSLATGPAL